MNHQKLNADRYIIAKDIYATQLMNILYAIFNSYERILATHATIEDDENKIRDLIVVNYLRKTSVRKEFNLLDYDFDRETLEDHSDKRPDIRIKRRSPLNDNDSQAYYLIECKRLNNKNLTGKTGLNAEYVKNGIMRFINGNYSTFYSLNGMIGFIVSEMDINNNISYINQCINNKDIATTANGEIGSLMPKEECSNQFIFKSYNKTEGKKPFQLFHLMLDFSSKIDIN